jgi:hypothetical protein
VDVPGPPSQFIVLIINPYHDVEATMPFEKILMEWINIVKGINGTISKLIMTVPRSWGSYR